MKSDTAWCQGVQFEQPTTNEVEEKMKGALVSEK